MSEMELEQKQQRSLLLRQQQIKDDDTDTESESYFSVARAGKRQAADCITDLFKCIDNIKCLRSLDGWIASAIMLAVLLYSMYNVLSQAYTMFSYLVFYGQLHGIRCTRLINDTTFSIVLFLVCLFWHTLCFKNERIRGVWQAEARLIGNVMAGGFIPKPAAASMGLLLFVNSNLVANEVVMGENVFAGMADGTFDSCVANSQEIGKFPAEKWFQRVSRDAPEGCYMVQDDYPEYPWLPNTLALEKKPFFPEQVAKAGSAEAIPGLVHPVVNGTTKTDLYCTYYCSAFNSVALSDIVTSIGEIASGAAVVGMVSDLVTTHLGWHLVTDTTSARELVKAMLGVDLPKNCDKEALPDDAVEQLQNVHIHRPGSPFFCAVQLLLVLFITREISPRVSINGRFTVDYYTTFLMLMASLYALILRFWSPFNCRSVIFTKNLWTQGYDTFLEYNRHHKAFEEVTFNLYDWLHTPSQERKRLLLHYCRRVTMGRLAGTYNDKGFIPEMDSAEPKEPLEPNHVTGLTDKLVEILGKCVKCIRFVLCPWRLLRCNEEEAVDIYATQKLQVDTTHQIYISKTIEDWKDVDGQPVCDQKNHRIVIDQLVQGTILSLGQEPDTVVVEFTQKDREPGDDIIALFLGDGDEIEFDKTGTKVLNKPVPPTGERDGLPVWTFEVPVDALREISSEWKFTRKLFGEKSLKNRLGS